jgi:hypothetical protein
MVIIRQLILDLRQIFRQTKIEINKKVPNFEDIRYVDMVDCCFVLLL